MKKLNSIRLIAMLLFCGALISGTSVFVSAQEACDFSTVSGIAGIWSLSAQGVSTGCTDCTPCQVNNPNICGTAICGSFGMGDADIHVSQTGATLYASEGDVNGNPFTLTGSVSGSQVSFTIEGTGITPGVGPATTTYSGTLSGDTITGSFSGYASWPCTDVHGNSTIETATWTGTFIANIAHIERCFGGIGNQCEGNVPLYEFERHEDTCLVNGWMSVGSILHDSCCVRTGNTGYRCANSSTRECNQDWALAKSDVACSRRWEQTFGPYPAGNTGDDTTQALRAPSGAPVHPQHEDMCQSQKCQVNAKGKTIIYGVRPCKYCICQ